MNTPNNQDNPFTLSPDELDVDEIKRYAASLGDIAHRYPIRREFWSQMEDISVQGAALYSLGIDPSAISQEFEGSMEPVSLDDLPKDFPERLSIIKSAARVGTLKAITTPGSKTGVVDDDTRIATKGFLDWLQKKGYSPTPMREVSTVERETLYKIIIGMAVIKYKYDPKATRNAATGEKTGSIFADLEMAGVSVDVDTIRKHLQEASGLLPPKE